MYTVHTLQMPRRKEKEVWWICAHTSKTEKIKKIITCIIRDYKQQHGQSETDFFISTKVYLTWLNNDQIVWSGKRSVRRQIYLFKSKQCYYCINSFSCPKQGTHHHLCKMRKNINLAKKCLLSIFSPLKLECIYRGIVVILFTHLGVFNGPSTQNGQLGPQISMINEAPI